MRILYHHRTQGEEPESVHIAAIVNALRRLGHEVDILGPARVPTSGRPSKRSFVGRIKRRTPRVLVELAQIAFNAVSFAQLAFVLSRRRYDFVYERYALYNFAGILAARTFGLPLILEANTLYAQAWQRYYGLIFRRVARSSERLVIRGADAVICVTGVLREMLEKEHVKSARITVAHNAIDPEEFDPGRFQFTELRRELRLPALVAGFVGTMNRWQAVLGFADVIERVVAERPDIGFLFVGDGEGRAGLEAELRRREIHDFAVFVGRQPHREIPRYVSAIDIGLLLDSNAYGSPMKIFEYWAMGKVVIAPAVDPVLEVMCDGETGFVIAPGDAPAMARHILDLAADPVKRARLGEAGRRRVVNEHTWKQNAEKILRAAETYGQSRVVRLKRARE